MKILLLTNENSTNFGDDFLSETLKKKAIEIKKEVRTGDFVFYRKHKSKIIGLFCGFLELIKLCKNTDKVIVSGGNLILPLSIQFVFCFSTLTFLKYFLRFKIEVRYVGVSGFSTSLASRIMLYNIKRMDYISVRDNNSKRILSENFNINSNIICDAAFLNENTIKACSKFEKSIIFIPIDYNCLPKKKKKEISELSYNKVNIDFLLGMKNQGYKVKVIVSDSVDRCFANKIARNSGLERKSCRNLKEFEKELQNFNGIVVATRMHAIILSILAGNKTIGVNWSDKVEALIESFNNSIPLVSFSTLAKVNIEKTISRNFRAEDIAKVINGNRKLISSDFKSAIEN